MKLLFVSNLYPPNVLGGYERLCGDVVRACVERGHEITVLTSSYGGQRSRHPDQVVHQALELQVGATVYQSFAGSPARYQAIGRANLTALRRVIADAKPDRIFCWNLYGLDRSFLEGLVESGVRTVLMLTDNWLANMLNPGFVAWYFRSRVHAEPGLPSPPDMGRIDFPCAAVFGAAYMRSFYQQTGLFFADDHVVHNGVEQHIPPGAVFRDRSAVVRNGEFSLLFAGRIVSLKGLHTAIEALPLLNGDGGSRVTLTVLGDDRDGDYMRGITDLIARTGVGDLVSFRPTVAAEDLFDLFQAYDAYVFPSLYEPFSLTLIHALGAGIPTVASAAGGNVEIVRDGETGILFDRGDAAGLARAVRALIASPELRQALSAKGRAISTGFTFDGMVDRMLTVLTGC